MPPHKNNDRSRETPLATRAVENALVWAIPAAITAASGILWGIYGDLHQQSNRIAALKGRTLLSEHRIVSLEQQLSDLQQLCREEAEKCQRLRWRIRSGGDSGDTR